MARPENSLRTVEKRIRFPEPLFEELELLARTGYFGASVNEAVVQLVSQAVRAAHAEAQQVSQGRAAYTQLSAGRARSKPGK